MILILVLTEEGRYECYYQQHYRGEPTDLSTHFLSVLQPSLWDRICFRGKEFQAWENFLRVLRHGDRGCIYGMMESIVAAGHRNEWGAVPTGPIEGDRPNKAFIARFNELRQRCPHGWTSVARELYRFGLEHPPTRS